MSINMIKVRFLKRIGRKKTTYGPGLGKKEFDEITVEEYEELSEFTNAIEAVNLEDVPEIDADEDIAYLVESNNRLKDKVVDLKEMVDKMQTEANETKKMLSKAEEVVGNHSKELIALEKAVGDLSGVAKDAINTALKISGLSKTNEKKFNAMAKELDTVNDKILEALSTR